MIDTDSFRNARLQGGFVIAIVEFTDEPLVDAAGREAVAKTGITGDRFEIVIRAGLEGRELSVTLYHEILEAAAVASSTAPQSVLEFGEADFERVASAMHDTLGEASVENVNRMLRLHGFRRE
jgi:hypothetical protein